VKRMKQELRLMGAVNLLGTTGIRLVDAGKRHVDQLLRALIPYYIAEKTHLYGTEITCGDVSRFWKLHGVRFSAPAAGKALLWHIGYARRTKGGRKITPNGLKYVEAKMRDVRR
jgi:ribosomal protein S19E (S16A)